LRTNVLKGFLFLLTEAKIGVSLRLIALY